MDPITQALILCNTLALIDKDWLESLPADKREAVSARVFDAIEMVINAAVKAHNFLHPPHADPAPVQSAPAQPKP